MKGFQMLRVNVLAAPIDITAAGTSAPSAIAAKQKPANQSGNAQSTSCGTASCGVATFTPAAIAISPSKAIKPRTNEYAGRVIVLKRMALPLEAASEPVSACGYMNNAIAEPIARVM